MCLSRALAAWLPTVPPLTCTRRDSEMIHQHVPEATRAVTDGPLVKPGVCLGLLLFLREDPFSARASNLSHQKGSPLKWHVCYPRGSYMGLCPRGHSVYTVCPRWLLGNAIDKPKAFLHLGLQSKPAAKALEKRSYGWAGPATPHMGDGDGCLFFSCCGLSVFAW